MERKDFSFGVRLSGGPKNDFYSESSEDLDRWIEAFSHTSVMRDIEDDFSLMEKIGSGQYSAVFLTLSRLSPSLPLATKRIPKTNKDGKSALPSILTEITALRKLNHIGVAKLHHVYENEDCIDLVMDCASEGTLEEKIERDGPLPPCQLSRLTRTLLEVLSFAHSQGVTHRDIKPANILCFGESFRLTDFGLAALSTEGMRERCGSRGFVAPEVLSAAGYDSKVDVYSAGVTVLIASLGLCALDSPHELCDKSSLLREMVSPDPLFRPTASEALALLDQAMIATPKGRLPTFRFPPFSARLKQHRTDRLNVERKIYAESCGSTAPSTSD